ncbi:peptidylprolyl isomerase [Rivularia sp. UHCC 0363]|uniref:peptidylprolyl isomerase n=1 Tax=Rivularia sp. UHCC 0363 TaxID=3110244 RepID=UPI002B2137CD|nr:peptidylprolyl isomerase [Rivularia sp. UHCC 0363]MEA5596812.1 peptidylprolyl isomerase [Rivularia sp. UHCC 0363]
MTAVLQIGDRTINLDEIVPLLKQYGMLPQLLKEIVIDNSTASIPLTEEEVQNAYKQFYQQQQLADEQQLQAWLQSRSLEREQLDYLVTRAVRVEKFKQDTWGSKLESYFLQRKEKLDKVMYSLIRINDIAIAQELYFRVQEDEQPFAELAREYSKGPEAQTGGLIGPVELGVPHPVLAKMLLKAQPGQVLPPTRLGDWILIVRLDNFIPAQLDAATQQRLLNEQFEAWVQAEISSALKDGKLSADNSTQS